MKKKLKSHLKTLQWLKDSGFQYFVRVDKTFGYRTDDSTDLDDQSVIEARLPPVPETLCGIPTRVNSISGRGSVKPQIEFTIGGLICMDDDLACLTAGHPFLPLTREDKSETESSGSEDEDSDYSISGSHSETETDNTEGDCTGQKPGSPPGLPGFSTRFNKSLEMQKDPTPFQTFRHKGLLSHFGPYAQPRPEEPAIKGNGNDWAVLLMGLSPSSLLPNKFQVPGDEHPTFVDQIVSTHELVKGPVWVAAGSGVRKGVLNPNPASIFLRGSFRNVRQIMLDESLKHGDSGSWVIAQGKLIGFIIAGRDSLPWGYMLLVEEVFEDMVNCLGQYQKISLPSREFIETARRKLEKGQTFEAQDQSTTFEPSEADPLSRNKRGKPELSYKVEQEAQANKDREFERSSREPLKQEGRSPEVSNSAEWSVWEWDEEGQRWCRTQTNSEGEKVYDYDFGPIPLGAVLPTQGGGIRRNLIWPTKDQCFALTDEQCRRIQDILDPDERRFQRGWELKHQPELIRLYMTGMSFLQMESAMTPRLIWSYKTYSNRFRDWCFPVNPIQRQIRIIQLYSSVSRSSPDTSTTTPVPSELGSVPPFGPLPLRPRLPLPSSANFAQEVFQTYERSTHTPGSKHNPADRISISTIDTMSSNTTWLSSSATSIFSTASDIFSDQASIATTNSSASRSSVLSHPEALSKPEALGLRRPLKPPIHDPSRGLWNGTLRVIPCGDNHQSTDWQGSFARCSICGFTPWHALMINSRSMNVDEFVAAMSLLDRSSIKTNDYAGNSPIHFLMAAGVKIAYFVSVGVAVNRQDSTNQNVFGQNPFHVLNPQDLGDDLVYLLEWFRPRRNPPGILLTQRDIYGRTPLHTLLQHPFPRTHYPQILEVFPFFEHQLLCLNTTGQSVVQMMNMAALKLRPESESDYLKIQDGISDIKQLLAEFGVSGGDGPKYSFNDIARGAGEVSWFGIFNCRICSQTNNHSSSYLDQMKCACANRRDRNAPDETGLTPAHAIITKERSNQGQDETPAQTAELFRILIPPGDPLLLEALHVLDPEGHTLVRNIAVRGLHEILQYVLDLETPARRVAMVNACSIGVDGVERSVYACVLEAQRELNDRIRRYRRSEDEELREFLVKRGTRLKRCMEILAAAGAATHPNVTQRWRIDD